jgi:hypothetical protein
MNVVRLSLELEDFKRLVAGEIVVKLPNQYGSVVEIALKDIGYDVMIDSVLEAQDRGNCGGACDGESKVRR